MTQKLGLYEDLPIRERLDFIDQLLRREAVDAKAIPVLVSTQYMDEAERCNELVYIAYGCVPARDTAGAIVQATDNFAGAHALLQRGDILQFLVIVPDHFGARIVRGETLAVWIAADATDPSASGNALAALNQLAQTAQVCLGWQLAPEEPSCPTPPTSGSMPAPTSWPRNTTPNRCPAGCSNPCSSAGARPAWC